MEKDHFYNHRCYELAEEQAERLADEQGAGRRAVFILSFMATAGFIALGIYACSPADEPSRPPDAVQNNSGAGFENLQTLRPR